MTTLYRDDLAAARIQRDELLARRREEMDEALASAGVVYADRAARSVAGLTAIVGAALVAALAAWNGVTGALGMPTFAPVSWNSGPSGMLTLALILAWIGTGAAYVAGRRSAWRAIAGFERATAGPASADVHADLERLRGSPPPSRIRELAAARERASVVYPLVGFVLLAPLGFHLLVYSLFLLPGIVSFRDAASFDVWVGVSLLLVGHCHVVAALLQRSLGRRMLASETEMLSAGQPRSVGVLGWTVLVSLLPGMIACMKSPGFGLFFGALVAIFVAVTGVAVIPTSAAWMRRRLVAERERLG